MEYFLYIRCHFVKILTPAQLNSMTRILSSKTLCPRVSRFTFRWTRVTRALGTRLTTCWNINCAQSCKNGSDYYMYFKRTTAEKTTKPAYVKSVDQLFPFSLKKSGNFVNLKGNHPPWRGRNAPFFPPML